MSRRLKRLRNRRRARPRPRRPEPTKRVGIGVVLVGMAGVVVLALWANQGPRSTLPEPPSWLPKCPVGGGAVNFAHRASTPDGPVFFCCEHCVERYGEKPTEYVAAVQEQFEILARLPKIQVTCPVSGDAVSEEVGAEVEGRSVQFCSPTCRATYVQAPDRFKAAVADSYWYQTRCPVDDMPISPQFSTTLPTRETVYLCSERCRTRFTASPTKFATQLAKQGIRLHLD